MASLRAFLWDDFLKASGRQITNLGLLISLFCFFSFFSVLLFLIGFWKVNFRLGDGQKPQKPVAEDESSSLQRNVNVDQESLFYRQVIYVSFCFKNNKTTRPTCRTQKKTVGVLLESEYLLQNEAKTLCFTVFFDHQGAEN